MGGQTITLIKTAADIHISKSVWFWFLNITSPSGFAPPSHYHSLPTTTPPLLIERTPQICNWTEWSAIWSEIICVISKSNERAARVPFEITSSIRNYHFITLYIHFEITHFFLNLYLRNRKRVYMYVPCQQSKMTDVTLQKTHWSAKPLFIQMFKQFKNNLVTAKIVFFKV